MSNPGLTPIEEAIPALLKSVPRITDSQSLPLEEANGRLLAKDVYSPMNVPPATNSAMDGYAVRAADVESVPVTLVVSQRIAAGEVGAELTPGSAARIFTGAPIPPSADAVVMQENTESVGNQITVKKSAQAGENLRIAGDDVREGQMLFSAGHRLKPQDIGVLSSVGLTEVSVIRKPRVALFTTGDELVTPGTELMPGQIYNSNHYSISSLLKNLQVEIIYEGIVGDDFESTRTKLQQAASECDAIITTGGVSVGEEDHVKAAIESIGHIDLWKLAIKPGKPFASGKAAEAQFFGLPGNPVSAFVTFVLLVRPALLAMQSSNSTGPQTLPMIAGFDARKSGERQEYIRVAIHKDEDGLTSVMPYTNQSSGVAASLSSADGLAIIPPHTAIKRGDMLELVLFSQLIY